MCKDVEMVLVRHRQKREVWDYIYPILSRADDFTCTLAGLMLDILESPTYELWVGYKGSEICFVTLCQNQGNLYFIIKHASNDKGYNWEEMIKNIEERSRELGIKHVGILGRKGWAKVLKEYKIDSHFYLKEVQ